jgi:hypothetical protein
VLRKAIQNVTVDFPDYSEITTPHHRLDSRNDFWFEWCARDEVGAGVGRDGGNSVAKRSRPKLGVDESDQVVGYPVHPTLVAAQLDFTRLGAMRAIVGPSVEGRF